MNTLNPKFWASVGFVIGMLITAGGELSSLGDALFGGLIQAAVWFGISSLIIRSRKLDKAGKPDIKEVQMVSLWKRFIGGFFFLGGIFLILGYAFQADGASLGVGIFNIAIGAHWFWPTARIWLNKIPFPRK